MENIRLMIRVENYEKYKERVKVGPYIRQMDLVIFCCQILYLSDEEIQARHVTWEMLKRWDISPEALFQKAGEDSRIYLPPYVQTLEAMLIEHMARELMEQEHQTKQEAYNQAQKDYIQMFKRKDLDKTIYVISNQNQIYGASVVFYEDVLKKLAKAKGDDLILLPSSIHEWLAMTETEAENLRDLENIVRDANHFVVSEAEVLSNHVYRYSLESNMIEKLEFTRQKRA